MTGVEVQVGPLLTRGVILTWRTRHRDVEPTQPQYSGMQTCCWPGWGDLQRWHRGSWDTLTVKIFFFLKALLFVLKCKREEAEFDKKWNMKNWDRSIESCVPASCATACYVCRCINDKAWLALQHTGRPPTRSLDVERVNPNPAGCQSPLHIARQHRHAVPLWCKTS